jgi:hypothetical protein
MILLAMEAAADHQQPADDCGRNGKPADCLAGTHHHHIREEGPVSPDEADGVRDRLRVGRYQVHDQVLRTADHGQGQFDDDAPLPPRTKVMSCASSCPADVVV